MLKQSRLFSLFLNLLISLTIVTGAFAGNGKISGNSFTGSVLALPPVQGPQPGGEQPLHGEGPWVVRAYFTGREMVNAFAGRVSPWEVHHDLGYLVAEVDRSEYQFALNLGFRLEVDEKLTSMLHTPLVPLEGQINGIPGYPCYRTVEETFAAAIQITQDYPNLAEWVDIGDSWEKNNSGGASGYDLMVLVLTNKNSTADKAKLFIMSSVHAREYTPAELSMRYAEYLVQNYDSNPEITWILDHTEIHLLLQANPDGRIKAEAGLSWRKNTNTAYCGTTSNNRGADLNRNYWFKWGCCGGSSGSQCDLTYRGPSPASEPETQAVQNYVRSILPDQRGPLDTDPAPANATGIFLDIHSYSKLVLWPWGWTYGAAPNMAALQTLGRKFAYFNNYTPQQSTQLYVTDGTTDDFAYGELGLSAYTFELGNSFFESCSAFENTILPDNLPALVYAAKAARLPYMEPAGPDTLNILTLPSAVEAGTPVQITGRIDDTRFNNSNGAEPVQNIIQAEYYIDVPPWSYEQNPVAYPMLSLDGSFNATAEDVTGTIDTSELSEGRHLIFVRGKDASGNWGPVSAAFLYIIDPSTSPVLEGYVRSSGDNTALNAVLTAGDFSTMSDPVTGYYSMYLASGAYTLQVASEGYASASISGIVLEPGERVQQNVYLDPVCTVFLDNVEGGSLGWTAQTPWAITTTAYNSPTRSWTDSPAGQYANNLDVSLTSQAFNFSNAGGVELQFWHRYDLEAGYDYAYVEYSTNGGATWTTASSYTGINQATWRSAAIPLPALSNVSNARVRFRLSSDLSIVRDGWYIDDIRINAGSSSCIPPQPPQAGFTNSGPAADGSPVHFTDMTVGTTPLTYEWDFGDGLGTSSQSDPTYIFPYPGVYTVTLEVSNAYGLSSASQPVTVYSVDISAVELEQADQQAWMGIPVSFAADIFPDYASKPYTYTIRFGDGSSPISGSSSADPLIFENTFSSLGSYTVEIEAANAVMTEPVTASLVTQVELAGMELTPLEDGLSGNPGEQVMYSFVLTNTGSLESSFSLSLGESSWPVSLSTSMLENVLPGTSESFSMTVTIPPLALAGENDLVLLTASGPGSPFTDATAQITTTANHIFRIDLVPVQTAQSGDPGSLVVYDFEVTNTGNAPLTLNLEIFGQEWISDLSIETISQLPPQQMAAFSASILVPQGALVGDSDEATVQVEMEEDPSQVIQASLLTSTNRMEGLLISPSQAGQMVEPGSQAVYSFELSNTGNAPITASLTLEGAVWESSLSEESIANLGIGESSAFSVSVQVPANAAAFAGDMVIVRAASEGSTVTASAEIATTAHPVYGLDLVVPVLARSALPGSQVEYTLLLTNTGNILGNIQLELQESSWPVELSHAVLEDFQPGDSATISVTVSIPDQAPGGQLMPVSLLISMTEDPTAVITTTFTTTVVAIYQLEAWLNQSELTALPGEILTYTAWITNTGLQPANFILDLSGNSWETQLSNERVEDVLPGATFSATVTVTIPEGAYAGEVDTTSLNISIQEDPAQSTVLTLTTKAEKVSGLSIFVPVEELNAYPGVSASYLIKLTNTSNFTETYRLVYTSTWEVGISIQQAVLEPGSEIDITPAQSRTLIVSVRVPEEAANGAENRVEFEILPLSQGSSAQHLELLTRAMHRSVYMPLIYR
jgi:carboxypeptidase T